MRKLYSLFFILIFVWSCTKKEKIPPDILQQSKMQAILWDLVLAGEFLDGYIFNKDSIDKVAESSRVYAQVFQVHDITKAEFDKSYNYYRQHPALLKVILDSLGKKEFKPSYQVPRLEDSTQNKILEKIETQ